MPTLRHAFVALTVLCLLPTASLADVPDTLQLQGALRTAEGTPVVDGIYSLDFALYAAKTGGSAAWTETNVKTVIQHGHFTHVLGVSNPISKALLALKTPWIGIAVAGQTELPREPLHAVAYALAAITAQELACSGCVGSGQLAPGAVSGDKIGFTYAGSKTKGGPALAALDLQCTGCVSLDELKLDGDLDLGGNALKAKSVLATTVQAGQVAATTFVGDGSKLTGLSLPAGSCPQGQLVQGIAPDGKLKCAEALAANGLPKDGLSQVSNGVLSNVFTHEVASTATPLKIKDNDPIGVGDTIVFPDVGLAKTLTVSLELKNSDISGLTVTLFDPANETYVLYDKGAKGVALKGAWPAPDKTVSGDLGSWVGKNPQGKWRLKVVDSKALTNGDDGAIESWKVVVETISNKAVAGVGLLQTDGGLQLQRADKAPVPCDKAHEAYLWYDLKTRSLMVCNGELFVPIKLDNPGTQNNPAASCASVLALMPYSKDGVYWIDPDGPGKAVAFPAWCDMTTKGGGWMLLVTLMHQSNQYGGSAHPMAVNLNPDSPKPTAAYSRDWRALLSPQKSDEFLLKRGTTGEWVRFVVTSFCGFDSTDAGVCTGCHATYSSGCVYDSADKQLGCNNTWLNGCSNCGGCASNGCDTIGFNVNHADYAALYDNSMQLYGAGWHGSNCYGAWGTAGQQTNVFPITLWFR